MTNVFTDEETVASRQLIYMHGGVGGYPPGSFAEHLIRAMMHADQFNLEALLEAFPQFRKPVFIMRNFGMDSLQQVLDGPRVTEEHDG